MTVKAIEELSTWLTENTGAYSQVDYDSSVARKVGYLLIDGQLNETELCQFAEQIQKAELTRLN